MDSTGGGKPLTRSGTYWGAGVGGRWSLLGSLRTRRLVTLMDRLGRRGGLFLEWASAAFGDGERRGSGDYQRIIHHLPVDLHHPAQRFLYLCQDGKGELGGEVPASARLGWPPTEFVSAHFHLTTGLLARVTRPSV